MLKHRVQGCALPAMLPSSPSADLSQYATLRLCFGRAVFFVAHTPFHLILLVAATLPLLSLRDIFPRPGEVGPQGDGFSGNDKVSGTAQRRPLGGAVERSETEGISLTAPPKARCGCWAPQPVSSGSHFKSSHAKGAAAQTCGSPGGCFWIQALTRGLRSRCTDPRSSWRKRPS